MKKGRKFVKNNTNYFELEGAGEEGWDGQRENKQVKKRKSNPLRIMNENLQFTVKKTIQIANK